MNLKKFLKFYGSIPGNYDQETREWIANTTPNKLQKELQKYRTAVGVDFYNLDLSGIVFPAEEGIFPPGKVGYTYNIGEGGKVLREFYLKHMGGPIDIVSSVTGKTLHLEEGMFVSILSSAPQGIYQAIVDKAITGETMTKDEIKYINEGRHGYETYEEYVKEKDRYELKTRVYFGHYGIIKALYEFVYDVSTQRVKIGRCELEGCKNIFIINPRGHAQKYCSKAHKMVEYRKRKKQMALV